jgi:hypothetical protein
MVAPIAISLVNDWRRPVCTNTPLMNEFVPLYGVLLLSLSKQNAAALDILGK